MSINKIGKWLTGNSQKNAKRRRPTRRLGLESLESRECPSGLTGGLSGGVLTINGSTAADTITLSQTGNTVRIEGYTNTWNAGAISKIKINGGGGNDTVRVAVSPQLAATLVADGGAGYDVLYSTAQPTSWKGFEAGYLIDPPAGPQQPPPPTQGGVKVEWSGTTGPYTVSYYRRGDSASGGELYGNYTTRQQAEVAVGEIQKWASQINNGGYWDIVRITAEGQKTTTPGGGTNSTYETAFANTFREISNKYDQIVAKKNEVYNHISNVAQRYRREYDLYQKILRLQSNVDQVFKNLNMTVYDVYRKYSQQSAFVWTNPSVLSFAAQQIRREANAARDYVNKNLPGQIWTPARNAAHSALQIMYDAADTMDNLAGAINRARGGV